MRGFYTNGLDAEAAEDVTMADVADTYHPPMVAIAAIRVPLMADPFENTDAADQPAPF